MTRCVRAGRRVRGRGVRCCLWWRRCLWAGAASTMLTGCGRASGVGVLGFAPAAASTLGTFLRSFTFGHLRQFDRFHELALGRAWSVGAAPQVTEMTVDVDSTVCEVHGKSKGGAAYGHTKVLGYHPLVAVRDDTGEVLHSRMRSGSSQRGHSPLRA